MTGFPEDVPDRREELEREGSETGSQGIRRWRLLTLAALIGIPLIFAIGAPASVVTASR
jgi:hypothetical protein